MRVSKIIKISKMSSSPQSYAHRDRLINSKKFHREKLSINNSLTYRIEQINKRSQENIDKLLKSTSRSHFSLKKKSVQQSQRFESKMSMLEQKPSVFDRKKSRPNSKSLANFSKMVPFSPFNVYNDDPLDYGELSDSKNKRTPS